MYHCKTYEPLRMIAFVEVLLWSHHYKFNTLFANSYLSQLVCTKKTIRFNKDYWDQNFAEKIMSKKFFLTSSVLSARGDRSF